MNFDYFISQLSKIQDVLVDGVQSHAKVEPAARTEFMKTFDFSSISPKLASVMILIYPKNGKAHFALIVRAAYDGAHSSQVAFPGGKVEAIDIDYWQTALRETEEEVGVKALEVSFLKEMTALYVPPSNFMVFPFIGFVNKEVQFIPDPIEVADIIEVDLLEFLSNISAKKKLISASYMTDIEVYGFEFNDFFVWGATAMIMQEFKDLFNKVL